MKLLLTMFLLILLSENGITQPKETVTWNALFTKTGHDSYNIYLKARIQKGWHLYSVNQPKEAIAIPTKISINSSNKELILSHLIEKGVKRNQYIAPLDLIQYYYADSVIYVQQIKVLSKTITKIQINISYSTCKDDECIPETTKIINLDLK